MFGHGDTIFPDLFRMIETPRSLLAAMPGGEGSADISVSFFRVLQSAPPAGG